MILRKLSEVFLLLIISIISLFICLTSIFSSQVKVVYINNEGYGSHHDLLILRLNRFQLTQSYRDLDLYPTCSNIKSYFSEEEIDLLAKLIWSESRGIKSDMHKAAIVWSVINRINTLYRGCIKDLLYSGAYRQSYKKLPVDEKLRIIVIDVLNRYIREVNGEEDVGRILPKEYIFWYGDGEYNYFRNNYRKPYTVWDWSLENPYNS